MKVPNKRKLYKILLYVVITIIIVVLVLVGRGVYMLRTQLPGYKEFWTEQNKRSIPEGAIVYVALGDSVAQGIGASTPENSYVWLFAKHVEERTGKPVHIVNLSVSGAKIRDLIDVQLPQLKELEVEVDIVTVDIGANDMKTYDPDRFASEFEEVLQHLPSDTLVANIPYFGPDFHGHGGKQAKQANQILTNLFADYPVIKTDIYAVTQGNDGLSYYGSDLFHPSDKSYLLWAEAFSSTYDGLDK